MLIGYEMSLIKTYVIFLLQNVAVEVVEDKSEEQVEHHEVTNNQSWYEDRHTGTWIPLRVDQLKGRVKLNT